jgi:hypothetical protein
MTVSSYLCCYHLYLMSENTIVSSIWHFAMASHQEIACTRPSPKAAPPRHRLDALYATNRQPHCQNKTIICLLLPIRVHATIGCSTWLLSAAFVSSRARGLSSYLSVLALYAYLLPVSNSHGSCVNSGAQALKSPPPAFFPLRSAATRHHC